MKRGDIFVLGEGYDGYYGVSPQSPSIAVATGAEARIDFGDFTRLLKRRSSTLFKRASSTLLKRLSSTSQINYPLGSVLHKRCSRRPT